MTGKFSTGQSRLIFLSGVRAEFQYLSRASRRCSWTPACVSPTSAGAASSSPPPGWRLSSWSWSPACPCRPRPPDDCFPWKKKKNEDDDVKNHAGAQFKVKASIGGLQFFFSLGASRCPRSNETLEWERFHYPSSRLSACSSPSGIRANSFSLFFSFFFSFLDKVLLKFWITPSFSFSGPLLWLFWQKRGWNEQCPFRCTAFHWYWLLTWRMK